MSRNNALVGIFSGIYLIILAIWIFRFPLSYELVGGDPSLIQDRDLTTKEYHSIDEAYRIRLKISNLLLYSSLLICLGSFMLRNRWTGQRKLLKVLMYASGVIAVILILVAGIHFIPGAPIR